MHQESRIVPYPAELMFRVVAEVENYPEFLPWVVGLRIKSRSPQLVIAEMMVGYKGFREKYTSRILMDHAAHKIDVTQTEGPFRKMESHWQFTPEGGGCRVDFTIDFEFKSKLLGAVAGASFGKAMVKMVEAFEARAKVLQKKEMVG